MEYKILAIGDVHLKVSNIVQIRSLCDKICKVIEEEKPNGVVLLGDLHHTHANMNVYAWMESVNFINRLTDTCAKVGQTWFKYLLGNHDIPSNNLFLEGIHPFKSLVPGVVVEQPETLMESLGSIAFVPYVPNGRFKEALSNITNQKYRVVFAHQEFKGADIGGFTSKNGDDWSKENTLVISGHIHLRSRVGNVLYVGSPYQTTFGEDDDKSITLLTFTDDGFSEKLIDLQMPKKLTIYASVEEINEHNYKLSNTDENRLIIQDSSVNIEVFKKTGKFKELQKIAKVIFKPTDKVFVRRDVVKKTFRELLMEYSAKEDPAVSEVLEEVLNAKN